MAEALYNKYRPQIFEDVVGQEHIERTLKNAVAADKISHAYLFCGPRGTGKTTTARLLAKALLCKQGPTPDPDGTCEDCELVAAGDHPDVYELDAASRTGVENVREEIIGKVNYAPTRGRYKVYIIDEVHMLSTAAFNALLKTLEEPPSHVVFILCTTDPQKVPETIQSRCQRFDFRRISSEELISRLGAICEIEGVRYEGDALDLIAHRANGGMRDALTSLEQLIAFGDGEVTTQLAERLLGSLDSSDLADIVRAIGERDAGACFRWTTEYMETGADLVQFTQDLTEHMRDMYVMSLTGADVALDITEAARRELEAELAWYGPDRLARMLAVLGDLASDLKTSTNQRLSFEIALTRMIRPESDITLASLAERVERLERQVARACGGVQAGGASGAGGGAQAGAAGGEVREPQGRSATQASATQAGMQASVAAAGTAREGGAPGKSVSYHVQASPEHTAPSAYETKVASTTSSARSCSGAPDNATHLWNSVLANLKKVGPAYGVVFMNTTASVDNGKLTIAFNPESEFAFKAAHKQDAREALEKALARAGAQGMSYEIVKAGAVQQGQAYVQPVAQQSPEPEPEPAPVPEQPASESEAHAASEPEGKLQPAQAERSQAQPAPTATEPTQVATTEPAQPATTEPTNHEPAATTAAATTTATTTTDAASAAPESSRSGEDPDFSDFITAAFGENIVIEEIQE